MTKQTQTSGKVQGKKSQWITTKKRMPEEGELIWLCPQIETPLGLQYAIIQLGYYYDLQIKDSSSRNVSSRQIWISTLRPNHIFDKVPYWIQLGEDPPDHPKTQFLFSHWTNCWTIRCTKCRTQLDLPIWDTKEKMKTDCEEFKRQHKTCNGKRHDYTKTDPTSNQTSQARVDQHQKAIA